MSTSAANTPGSVAAGSGRAWSVPGYTEVRPLGGGGFGEVVLATRDASGTPVAIKYLHPDLLRDSEHAAAFRAEARTLAGLDSPYVVRLYEYVEDPAGAAIVMELVEGVTLAALLDREGKTTPEAALVVLYGSLLGLAAAHAKGVVHRDYKPANVLVNGQGVSKLTDFGIAALAGDRTVPTGTLCYMPPEQFEGADASPAADVYAATVTFYQCLAGRVPFDGQTATEIYDKHKSAPVPMDEIPEPLQPVIARGMAKDPRSRPSDAGGLAVELRDAATDSYGEGWEDRGRSHLAEAALLLLALLWPSSGSPAVAGSAVEHVELTDPARGGHPGQPAQAAHPAQAGQATGSSGQTGDTEAAHLHHVEHLEHVEHVRHEEHVEHLEHAEHLEHVEHEHAEHVEHLEHLRAERAKEEAEARQPTRRPSRPRGRARVMTVAAAVAAAVVIGVVAALAATSQHSTPPPSGAPSPGASIAGPGTPGNAPNPGGSTAPAGTAAGTPSFAVSFSMTRHLNACEPTDSCTTEPLPLMLVCHTGGVCTASSGHWGASHPLTVNGNSMYFKGPDPGVSPLCNGATRISTITMDITVESWSGSGATRKPSQLTAQYTVQAPATTCNDLWNYFEATLTS